MADKAPEIKVTLTAEDKGVAAAIKELGNQLSQLKQKQQEVADSSLNLKNAFDAVISSAVVLKVIEFGKQVVASATSMARLSAATGISVGTLSVYKQAAGDAGVSQEKVNQGLIRLSTNIVKFEAGGKQGATAFQLLNLSQKSFVGLNADQKLALVTNAVGKMADGTNKAYIVNQLFGRGAANMIPVLDQLAGEGFDKVREHAQELGTYLAEDGVTQIAAAAVAMHELQDVGEGMATQFVTGLAPAISDVADALASATTQKGESGFKSLGETAGTAIRYIANLFLDIGATVGTVVAVIEEEFDTMWKALKLGGETVANAIKSGSFSGAWGALKHGAQQAETDSKDEAGRIAAIWSNLGSQVRKNYDNLFPTDSEEQRRMKERASKIKGSGGGDEDVTPPDNARRKAELSAIEAQLQEELALYKAKNAAEESANQIAYQQGLESLIAFFAKKKQLAKEESDEEIATLYAKQIAIQKAPTDGTDAQNIGKQQKLTAIQSQIDAAKVNAAAKQKQLDAQETEDKISLQEKVLEFQEKIAAAEGKTFDAAEAHINIEVQKMAIVLAQAGQSAKQIEQSLATYRSALEEQKSFKTTESTGKADLASLANAKEEIQLNNTELVAKEKIAELERARLPELQQIAAQLRAMAAASGDPQQVKAAEDYSKAVSQIKVNLQAASVTMRDFDNDATKAIQGDLTNFLGSTIDHVKGVGDAFGQLANSVVGSIQKIISQLIIQIAFQKLAAAAAAGGGGIGGLVSGLHLAGGGFVRGPGSATSDSIPARLSDGEFVVNARAVAGFGVHNLAAINNGVTVPSVTGMAVPHFAEGGLVQGGSASDGMDLHLGLSLDEGLILKHLASKRAGKIVLNHLTANPKAASKALSRAQ